MTLNHYLFRRGLAIAFFGAALSLPSTSIAQIDLFEKGSSSCKGASCDLSESRKGLHVALCEEIMRRGTSEAKATMGKRLKGKSCVQAHQTAAKPK